MLNKLVTTLDSHFRGELTLVLDYTKYKNSQQLKGDDLLELANTQFKQELEKVSQITSLEMNLNHALA